MNRSYIVHNFANGTLYFVPDHNTSAGLIHEGNKRILCTINEELTVHGALLPKKEIGYYVRIGATIAKKLNITEGSEIQVRMEPDHSPFQFDMPEELKEALHTDPEADQIFNRLTKGNQRSLMYLVNKVKTAEKRIERAIRITENLKQGITSPGRMMT